MAAQGARRALHLLGQAFEPRRGIQLGAEQLADAPEPGLAAGEFEVLLAAALGHRLMGNGVGQWQRLLEPAAVEGEGVVPGGKVQWAGEVFGVAVAVIRRGVLESRGEQRQRMTQQVIANDFERNQAELGVEHRHRRTLAVIGGDEPDAFAIVFQTQFEKCSQQRRITDRQAQSVTEGGTGQQRVTEDAVAGHVHAPAQFEADVVLERDRVGADLHFLIGGDARVGAVQIRGADAAAREQGVTGQALILEGVEHQRDGVEGGEVGVQHKIFQPGGWLECSKLHAEQN